MIKLIKLLFVLVAILLACGRSGVEPPTDATNEDAIYNIIRYDSPSAFNLDLFDLTIPDTSQGMLSAFQPIYWWHTIGHDSLDIDIRIFEPQPGDTTGKRRQGCTMGVATQDPQLVARFAGRSRHPTRLLRQVAGEVRALHPTWTVEVRQEGCYEGVI